MMRRGGNDLRTLSLMDWRPAPPSQPVPTSRAAAKRVEPRTGSMRAKVLAWFRQRTDGGTDEELIDAHGGPAVASTVRPRRIELVAGKFLRDSGRTRKTRAGLDAVVWVEDKGENA